MALTPRWIAGFDIGGTSTRVAVLDLNSGHVTTALGPTGNVNQVGWEGAERVLGDTLRLALSRAGARPGDVAALALCSAGINTDAQRARLASLSPAFGLSADCRVLADHDLRAALAGGLDGAPGIVVVSGTGSAAYGRSGDGRSWQSGGWDELLDDLGSGWHIARLGMRAACQSADGRLGPGRLAPLMFAALEAADVAEFYQRVHHPRLTREQIAALAPLVFQASAEGDAVAGSILRDSARELARMAAAVADRLFPGAPADVVYLGGTLMRAPGYADLVSVELAALAPRARPVPPRHHALAGALVLAASLMGLPAPSAATLDFPSP